MYKVIINGMPFEACEGELLSEVMLKNGIKAEHPCGGRGVCKKCLVRVGGRSELSCQYRVFSDISVELERSGDILSESGAQETGIITDNLAFALDIGTTTLALALVSLDSGSIVEVKTAVNPQRAYGADVISRIDYCGKNGLTDIQKVLTERINELIASFGLESAPEIFVSGNSTMLHIFLGIDPTPMGFAPYTPAFTEGKTAEPEAIGITGVSKLYTLPAIAAFVGADLVAGLNYVPSPKEGRYSLLVDLGTNAEVLLFSREKILSTAAAAGPCFEGANISQGMSAVPGAISEYSAPGDYRTIGNAAAAGICGTGLVDLMAVLLRNGDIDETGFMEDEEFEAAPGVLLTQADVRQYQLAKSAVYSAIRTLMSMEKLSFSDIDRLFISGGFSSKMNISNAVYTGLLPAELEKRCTPIGNSCLLGTVKYVIEANDLSRFTSIAKYVDLSANPVFSDLFIENMLFGE